MANNQRKNKFGGPGPRQDRAAQKRQDADIRYGAWFMLGPKLQLADLDSRLGKDVGAKRQRARIRARLAKAAA